MQLLKSSLKNIQSIRISTSKFHTKSKLLSSEVSNSLTLNEINTFSVVGSGQMGIGIGLVAAKVDTIKKVQFYDNNPQSLEKGYNFLVKLLEKDVSKNKISTEQRDLVLSKIEKVKDIEGLGESKFVVEAVVENLSVKQDIFKKLDQILEKKAILASNTSSIPITKIAASTKRPENVIGMHFMNPVPVMKLVEIISGLATSTHTLNTTLELSKVMGKTTTISQDSPGFIANRLLMPFINEAIFTLQEGVATKEDIDTTMKLGTNHPMGPLTLADFIGLDTCLAIMNVLHHQFGDSKYRPATLLRTYVDAGWLGKKSGRGFYKY
ncbi:hypothetical protein K502DRAFT_368167 [Neoconidiobolus thromboides FSU 785]|nr:hypothetical protein K502DRAFT_368167 [Neoconidiobolus thromboides FSU 785]